MRQSLRENHQRAFVTKDKLKTYRFTTLRPAGNDTCLISGIIRNSRQRKRIADVLQQLYPEIEQVGFITPDSVHAELMMTGGEFCGNATSCAAYQILGGKPGEISITVSGVEKKLRAGVTEDGEGFSQIPVYPDPSYITQDSEFPHNTLVKMEGITHYVDFNVKQLRGLTIDEIKKEARKVMAEKQIDHNPACGVIYAEPSRDGWEIHPIVYVKDADTLYYETACGSGTTALGLVLAKEKGSSIATSVLQPSGLSIKVSITYDGKTIGYTQIQSPIEIRQEGALEVPLSHSNMRSLYIFSPSRGPNRMNVRN